MRSRVQGGMRQQRRGSADWAELMVRDIKVALRQIDRRRHSALAFIFTMALGVGANAVVFSAINAAFFKLPPVHDIERVVLAKAPARCAQGGCREPAVDWVARAASHITAMAPSGGYSRKVMLSASFGDRSATVSVVGTSGSYFDVLGVMPFAGRLLGSADDIESGGDAAVVSHQFWRETLGERIDAVGQTLSVGGRTFSIVGIAPPEFVGLEQASVQPTAVWIPLRVINRSGNSRLIGPRLIGRLRDGRTLQSAADELRGITAGLWDRDLGSPEISSLTSALRDAPGAVYATAALLLMPCLLIACLAVANLTVLLFARLSGRLTEIATRMSLGASRVDIMRMLGVEIGLLVLAGSGAGVWLGAMAARLIELPEFGGIRVDFDLSFDWRVFGYSLIVAAGSLCVVVSRVGAHVFEGDGMSGFSTSAAGTVTFRSASGRARMIAFQAGTAAVVLVLAGLFFRSAMLSSAADPALHGDHAGTLWLDHNRQGHTPSRAAEVSEELLQAASHLPEVRSAALFSQMPGYHGDSLDIVRDESGGFIRAQAVVATEGFVDAFGLRLIDGRRFSEVDTARSEPVVIVSDRIAALLWPGHDPVGRELRWSERSAGVPAFLRHTEPALREKSRRVIGVVSSVVSSSRHRSAGLDVYVPLPQATVEGDYLIVARGDVPGALLAGRLGEQLRRTHPAIALFGIGSLSEQFGMTSVGLKWMGGLLASLGFIATSLAVVGLFGVIAHTTAIRRRELGIMRALGATNGILYRQSALEGTRIFALGALPAILLSLLIARLIGFSFLGFRWFDPQVIGIVVTVLLLFTLTACVLPVRSALQESPLVVLRDA